MAQSIQAIKFKTSNPDKFAILVGSTEEKVDQSQFNKGMIICIDSSGSMGARFTDPDLSVNSSSGISSMNQIGPHSLNSLGFQIGPQSISSVMAPSLPPVSLPPVSLDFNQTQVQDYNIVPPSSNTMAFNNLQTPTSAWDATPSLDLHQTPIPPMSSLGIDSSYSPMSSQFTTPMIPPSSGFGASYSSNQINIPNNTRLGCVENFMIRIFDLFDFIHKTQGIKLPISVVVFSTRVKVISNVEEDIDYSTMKMNTRKALLQGGGTNYELAIEETMKLKPKYNGDVTTIFLSDGGHANGKLKKEELISAYPKFFNYCIGIGEGESDYDEGLLKDIGEEFIRGTNPQRIRDTVASIALGIATMRAKNIHITSTNPEHILIGNMEKKSDGYRHKEMSMLMELYFSVDKDVDMTVNYEKSDGTKMMFKVDKETKVEEDVEFGDKILNTMDILESISKIGENTKVMSPTEKLKYLNDFKKSIVDNPITKTCNGTRIHNYYLSVLNSVDKMILTRDERRLRDLTKNVKSDVYNAVSSAGTDIYCSPSPSYPSSTLGTPSIGLTPSAPCNKNKINNVKCNVCCTNNREVVFIPCGHFLCCSGCSLNPVIQKDGCPYCRTVIQGIIPVVLDDIQKDDDWDMVCQTCHREHVSCISKDCSHIFSCLNCIERQKRQYKSKKSKVNSLEKLIEIKTKEGKDISALIEEKTKLESTIKNKVECTICNTNCSAYIFVHI